MAQTYLQLCNRVLRRLNEVTLTSSSFGTAVGFQATVQDSINDALNDIYDAELNWPFLWAATTQTTSPYVQTYTLPTTYTEIDWNSFFRQNNLTAQVPITALKLSFISYQDWQDNYKADESMIIDYWNNLANPTATGQGGTPDKVFQYQDKLHFGLSTVPDNPVGTNYSIYYEYYFKPTDLVNATDNTVIPDQWSKVLIDGAMYYATMFRDNPEESQLWQQKFMTGVVTMRTRLINKQDYMRSDQVDSGYQGVMGYI